MNAQLCNKNEQEILDYFKDRKDGISTREFISNMSHVEFFSLPVEIRFSCISLNYFPKYSAQSPIVEIYKDKNGRKYINLKNRNEVSIFIIQLVDLINHKKTTFNQIAHPITSFLKCTEDAVAKSHVEVIWKLCLEWRDQFR